MALTPSTDTRVLAWMVLVCWVVTTVGAGIAFTF